MPLSQRSGEHARPGKAALADNGAGRDAHAPQATRGVSTLASPAPARFR
jgi:hypothetical protein